MQRNFTDFPSLIQRYRESKGLSRKNFGKEYGVTRQAVLNWESGQFEAPYKVLEDVVAWARREEDGGK